MSTPSLASFTAALAAETAARLRRHPARPDLADVIARARAIDEAAIPEGILAGVAELDGELDDELDEPERPDPGLASFAAAMRVQVEAGARAREMKAVPAPPRPARWRARAAAVTLAVAAAALFALGLSRLGPRAVDPSGERDPLGAAGAAADPDDASHPYDEVAPPPRQLMPAPEAAAPEATAPEASAPAAASETRPRAKEAPSLDELEARARERWAAGDLEGAEALFRRVVRRAGKGSRAELAYGDLFAIAKQRGGRDALADAWREYLRKFPRGRYADDARAGLCRRASDEAQPACWADYLHEHPAGAHAPEARRIASPSESP